jgi:hypothetical protein
MADQEEIGTITSIQALNRSRDDQGNEYVIIAAKLENGKPIDVTMTEQAAAAILLLLQRVKEDAGWILRDVEIAPIDIHWGISFLICC